MKGQRLFSGKTFESIIDLSSAESGQMKAKVKKQVAFLNLH